MSINGPALRVTRQLRNVAVADLVVATHVSAGYISKLETGDRRACSPLVFGALLRALGVTDRRVLIACPDHTHRGERTARRTVAVNGAVAALFREHYGETRDDIAARAGCTENYLGRIETGVVAHCSDATITGLARALVIPDDRALLFCPYGGDSHGRTPDDDLPTGPLKRPLVVPPAGRVPA